jgi:hypothetical protein
MTKSQNRRRILNSRPAGKLTGEEFFWNEDTFNGSKSSRYKHAVRHLAECRSLASVISDYVPFEILIIARVPGPFRFRCNPNRKFRHRPDTTK